MKQSISAKSGVEIVENARMNSKYGLILKSRSKANMIGHINNILSYKDQPDLPADRLIVTNYDSMGKRIKFKRHEQVVEH